MRRRKPDLMFLLATLIGLGVLVTGFSQGASGDEAPVSARTGIQAQAER